MATEVKPEVIKRTQDLLSKHIKKPPLTVKLLQKPPFRFLHDVITAVIRGTGFLDGVLTTDEMNHENIKDKEGKIAFLQKIIDAVAASTGTTLSARPTKIVAGHEPTKTNELLQAIGNALEKRKNDGAAPPAASKKAMSSKPLASRPTAKEKEMPASSPKAASSTKATSSPKAVSSNKVTASTKSTKTTAETSKPGKPSSDRTKSKETSKSKAATGKIPAKDSKTKTSTKDKKDKDETRPAKENKKPSVAADPMGDIVNVERREMAMPPEPLNLSPDSGVNEDTKVDALAHADEENAPQPQELDVKRPPSAHLRQRQPSAMKALAPAQPLTKQENAENIIPPGTERGERQPTRRPMSARPPSARPASARPAAPRVRDRGDVPAVSEPGPSGKVNVITDNDVGKDDEEDDFLVVQAQPAAVSEDKVSPTQLLEEGQHGHLVDQILETQKDLEDEGRQEVPDQPAAPKKVGIEWEGGRKRDREAVRQEVARLRQTVQKTTRLVNPLGKLMDFVHEDVDSMQRERQVWRETNARLAAQLRDEQRLTDQAVEPMKLQLQLLEDNIQQKREHISALKATTIQNDLRTKMLLAGGE